MSQTSTAITTGNSSRKVLSLQCPGSPNVLAKKQKKTQKKIALKVSPTSYFTRTRTIRINFQNIELLPYSFSEIRYTIKLNKKN